MILALSLVYNLAMTALDAVALRRLGRNRTLRTWLAAAGLLGVEAAMLAVVLGSLLGLFGVIRMIAFAVFLHGVVWLLGSAWLLRRPDWRVAIGLIVLGAIIVATGADAFLIEPTWLDVSHVQLKTSKIARPVRIVVLADLQAVECGDYEKEVFRRVLEEKPDLILLAGDHVERPSIPEKVRDDVNGYLRQIGFSAPLGVFAVQGNCDAPDWEAVFRGLPIKTVRTTESFEAGRLRLTFLSLGDSFNPSLRVSAPQSDRYHVVLGHSPDYALGETEADLLVAGHTHGGQVRLPWIGPLMTMSCVPRAWAAGWTELPSGAWLLVSRGVGVERRPAPELRFLCRPELVVIDLEPAREGKESPAWASEERRVDDAGQGRKNRMNGPDQSTAPGSDS